MKINMKELSSQNDKLQEQQKVLRVQYDQVNCTLILKYHTVITKY